MRFMMFMMLDPKNSSEHGAMPSAEAISAMMKYNEELTKAGVLLALDGLHPTSKGSRIHFDTGKPVVKDGPFTEAKEVIGGYWVIQVKSKAEAIEWARRCPAAGTGSASDRGYIELRQIFDAADFGPEFAEAPSTKAVEAGLAKNAKQ